MLEKVGSRIKEYGSEIKQNTQNFSEETQLRRRMKDLNAQIDKVKYSIGDRYYEEHREDAGGEFGDLIEEIRKYEEDIQDCQQRIRELREVWVCANCGAENPKDAVFCCMCGTRRSDEGEENPKSESEGRICPYCGAENSADALFCGNCGHKFTAMKPKAAREADRSAEVGEEANTAGNLPKDDQKKAGNSPDMTHEEIMAEAMADFSTNNSNSTSSFPKYQKERSVSDAHAVPPVRHSGEDPDLETEPLEGAGYDGSDSDSGKAAFCPNCGYKLDPDSVFCPNCGIRIITEG